MLLLSIYCVILFELSTLSESADTLSPKWPVTYQMNESTIIMICNYSGYLSKEILPKLTRFAIVDVDWSNANAVWVNESPMTCQQALLTQAKAIKAVNPKTKVFVYRNLAKALPWFFDPREKLLDPDYKSWFLPFKPNISYNVPSCTNYSNSSYHDNKCSDFYHDEWHRTPEHPSQCINECDCGKGLPCGEYVWDHRNKTLQQWLTDVFIMGPSENNGQNSTGLNNPNIDGFYIDDHWTNVSRKSGNAACDSDPFGGVSEIWPNCTVDMGINTQKQVTQLTDAWRESMTNAQQTIVNNNGFEWHLFRIGIPPDQSSCAKYLRGTGMALNSSVLMFEYSGLNDTQEQFEIDLAMFLLVRGPYAWLGYNWNGCHDTWVYREWDPMLDKDYGVPLGSMVEIESGVFERKWSKSTVKMDCNTYKPTITFT